MTVDMAKELRSDPQTGLSALSVEAMRDIIPGFPDPSGLVAEVRQVFNRRGKMLAGAADPTLVVNVYPDPDRKPGDGGTHLGSFDIAYDAPRAGVKPSVRLLGTIYDTAAGPELVFYPSGGKNGSEGAALTARNLRIIQSAFAPKP